MSEPAAQTVKIEGVTLEVAHIPGPTDRAPLVFLHEGLGCVDLWPQRGRHWPQTLCEATGRAGWLYSRRGYGRSDPIPDVRGPSRQAGFWRSGRHQPDYMHEEAWTVLPALLTALGVRRPVLVGHSDGATIALLHASRHDTAGCVVMAPHVMVEPVSLQAIAQARDQYLLPGSDGRPGLRDRLARYHHDVDNAFWQWNDVWLSEGFRPFDIRAECARISTPLLAIQGEDDEYGTLAQIEDIRRAAPHTRLAVLPQCGHSPHRDQPDLLQQHVTDFLASLG